MLLPAPVVPMTHTTGLSLDSDESSYLSSELTIITLPDSNPSAYNNTLIIMKNRLTAYLRLLLIDIAVIASFP